LDRAEAHDILHVEGEEVKHRYESGERDHLGSVGGCQSSGAEDGEREQRVAAAQFDRRQGDVHDRGINDV
jgi:hypothetical protein